MGKLEPFKLDCALAACLNMRAAIALNATPGRKITSEEVQVRRRHEATTFVKFLNCNPLWAAAEDKDHSKLGWAERIGFIVDIGTKTDEIKAELR